MESKHPTMANGKICYVEIPAGDIPASVVFYQKVFGWKIRKRGDGQIAFDDAANEVSGSWVQSRKHSTEPGILVYIMVNDIQKTIKDIESSGGKIVQPVGADAPEITARFSDPFGNVFGLYQEPEESKK